MKKVRNVAACQTNTTLRIKFCLSLCVFIVNASQHQARGRKIFTKEYHGDTIVKRKVLRWSDVGLHLSHSSCAATRTVMWHSFCYCVINMMEFCVSDTKCKI